MRSHSENIDLSRIAVNIDDLYNSVKEMKEAGEKIAFLEICEPMQDIELGKHLQFNAIGSELDGLVDYEYIEEVTEDKIEEVVWEDIDEDEPPEGYKAVAIIEFITE